jgi:DNA polymerase-3 subunit delta'
MPFRDVIGHRRLVALLSRSVHRGTLPPSLILAGPAGVGKRLVAAAIAEALNCTDPQHSSALEHDACGACPSCRRIARGVHADVVVVEPGDNGSIRIDQVRDIIERANFRPFEGRRRVVIIDQADALVVAAQNALLKTLEEPPASSVFLLVTSKPDLLLPTVQSRCPRLRFRPLGPEEVAEALVSRGRAPAEAHAVAAMAEGSIGLALQASAGELVDARDVALRVLTRSADAADRQRADSAKDLLTGTGSGGNADRERLAVHLRAMESLLRDVELLATGAAGASLANPDVRPSLERLTAYRGQRGVEAFAALDRALEALDANAGVKVVADWVALNV